MVSFNVYRANSGGAYVEGVCLATDEKPIAGITNGSILFAVDTTDGSMTRYMFDQNSASWVETECPCSAGGSDGGGGSGGDSGGDGGSHAVRAVIVTGIGSDDVTIQTPAAELLELCKTGPVSLNLEFDEEYLGSVLITEALYNANPVLESDYKYTFITKTRALELGEFVMTADADDEFPSTGDGGR